MADRPFASEFFACGEKSTLPFAPEAAQTAKRVARAFHAVLFVCSPLRGDAAANTERARGYCRQVYEAGYTPICPHIYFTQFLNDGVPEERAAGIEMGAALLKQCRALVVCGDNITEGMAAEIRLAERFRIPILTRDVFLPDSARDRPPPPQISVLEQIAAARASRESGAKPAAKGRNNRGEER